jgi:putative inorganic carbon (HCO3(-)) transporter
MSFRLYLLFVIMTFLRPIELMAPELVFLRPMLVLSILVLISSLVSASATKVSAGTSQHFRVMNSFMLVIGVSVILRQGLVLGISAMMEFAPTMIFYVVTLLNLTSIERLRKAGTVLVICILCQLSLSIYSYYSGFMADAMFYKEGLESSVEGRGEGGLASDIPALDLSVGHLWRMRSFGFLNDPNDFAQMLVAVMPMLLVFYRTGRHLRNAVFVLAPAAGLLFGIYHSHSRGALLGLASLSFFGIKRILGTTKTVVMVSVVVMAAMGLNMTGGRAYTANEESAGGRIDAWSEGLKMLVSHPVLGVGYGHFIEFHHHTAHNSFVLCFAELGVVGYFLWLGMIVIVFKQLNMAIEACNPQEEEYRWALALRTSLVGFFACAMFLSRSYHPPLFMLLGYATAAWHCAKGRTQGTPQGALLAAPVKWRGTTVKLEIFSLIVFYIIVIYKTLTVGRTS